MGQVRQRSVPFARNALFRGIPRQLLEAEKIVASSVRVPAGTVIFDEGDPPDYCYLVGSGAVRITKALPHGGEELLATIPAGEFFGDLSLYDASPRSARATAAVPTRLGRLDMERFARLRRVAMLQVTSNLADCTIERIRETNDRLIAELAAAGRLSRLGSELGTISHNLRSPLATIRNASDLLGEWLATDSPRLEDTRRFVEIIRRTADQALVQIDQLMARLRGEEPDARRPVPVGEILLAVRDATAAFFRNPEHRYRDDDASYRGEVFVDPIELVAALCNLVKNAVEALPPDGGRVEVSVAAEGSAVVFSVRDTGSGIPPEFIPRVFEKEFTHGKAGGTGLGLSHVRRVAEDHGGQVFVESEVGRGTTIRIRLPGQIPPRGA